MATVKLDGDRRIIIGHLIKDAEYEKVGKDNKDRTNVYIAYGREKDQVVRCALWGTAAVAAASLKKFDSILVTGEVKKSDYNGKTYFDISAEDAIWSKMVFVTVNPAAQGDTGVDGFEDVDKSDIPF